jgi:hypothetical protein
MGLHRQKIRVDERSDALIRVRLGIQPSAGASSRGCAEIQQDGPAGLRRLREGDIDVFTPLDGHASIL